METKKILILEDDLTAMILYSELFELMDKNNEFKIIKCWNGGEAIKKIKEEIPDVIISDLYMPLVSGVDFYKELKLDNNIRHIPIIIITADRYAKNKYSRELTDVEWMMKPVTVDTLFNAVEKSLSPSHANI